ncbi:MAG TPA: hypothetical protein VMF61_14825 [Candidatus Acidoferrales bacterium]|nr:hypothetical protein [Candidatus Acidoferrales bacterium]
MNALLIAGIVFLVVWYARNRFSGRAPARRPDDDALSHALLSRD